MTKRIASILAALLAWTIPVEALTLSDSLSDWRGSSAMEHVRLATQLGRSFVSINEGLTSDYFLKCIDDVSTYGNATAVKIEDAVRECVKARSPASIEDDE